jgi:hypothetical protein
MKTTYVLVAGLTACGLLSAQTKISGTGKCDKPETSQSIDVGDRSGHALAIVKQSCTYSTPMEIEGVKAKSYVANVMSDASGAKSQDSGYVVQTMENGDKVFIRFHGTGMMKDGQPASGEGTWSFTGGTGKMKGITGKGTYKSQGGEDQIEGEYSMAASSAKKK